MKKLFVILLAAFLLSGCEQANPEETTVSTTEPTTQATTAPTTVATTTPTTAPTEPEPTVLEPELWLTDPQYPSYEELFSQDVPYADYTTDWIVEHEGVYREYHFESWNGKTQVCSYYSDLGYPIPNTETFMDDYDAPQYLGSDGKYVYFYNQIDTNRVFQMELLTGKVVTLVDEEKIYTPPTLQANCVIYYTRAVGNKAEICRMYIPEQRVDVLCTVENAEYLFHITYPATTGGKISWYGLNPQIVAKAEALWADPNAGKIINEYDYTEVWHQFASGLEGMHQDFREMFFHHFEREIGILALERTEFDPVTGTYSKKLGTLDSCWLGSGFPHDHFNPVYEELAVPNAVMGPWQDLPGLNIQGEVSATPSEDIYVASYLVPGRKERQLFLCKNNGDITLLLDAPYTPIKNDEKAVYCVTDDNTIVEVSYDGTVCNTLYSADQGTLRNFLYCDGMICFREESRVLLIDIAARQYRVLMDHPGIYLELWFDGNPSFCFSLSEGLYYQQYLFNVETGTIEETFIL